MPLKWTDDLEEQGGLPYSLPGTKERAQERARTQFNFRSKFCQLYAFSAAGSYTYYFSFTGTL